MEKIFTIKLRKYCKRTKKQALHAKQSKAEKRVWTEQLSGWIIERVRKNETKMAKVDFYWKVQLFLHMQ